MSGRGRMTLCAFAATLMASAALIPLVTDAGWIVTAAVLLAVQAGVGTLTRRVPLARALTVAVQLLVSMLLMTLLFTGTKAVLGVLPGPEAVEEFGRLLSTGAADINRYAIPAPASEGIRLMLIGGVLLIGLAVDTLAVTFRSAAPAGLPLLALYSVAAGLSGGGASWLYFLLAASGYLLLLVSEGRDRLAQWGRVFGGAAPGGARQGAGALDAGSGSPLAPVRTGRRIGVLTLGVALLVPALLPALDGGLLGGTGGGRGGGGGGGTISAVNPVVSLQESLNQPVDREVLRYRTTAPQTQDMYLRLLALDEFDGTAWKSSERKLREVSSPLPRPAGLNPDVPATEISTNISAAGSYSQIWLPMPFPASQVDIDGRWRYEPEGRTLIGDGGQTTSGVKYSVRSLAVQPTKDDLVAAPQASPGLRREYTRVPADLPPVVRQTAREVTRAAGNDYERAVLLQDWFASEGGFTYDTQVQSGTGSKAIARFLEQKEGFCVHFAFSMAAMARTLGIPARVAVGFTPGTVKPDGTMSVGLRDAHAWPELYFEGLGWTRFEPTPTRGTAPAYTRQEAPSGGASDPAQPSAGASSAPSAAPRPSDSCPAAERRQGNCGQSAQPGAAGPTDTGPPAGTVLAIALGALALVLVPSLPLLWRTRVRAGRLGSSGRTPTDAAGRTLAAWREITDSAWDLGIPPDESQTPRRTAARIVRLGSLTGPAAEAAHRAAGAVEQVLYAPVPQASSGLVDDVHRVRAGLRESASRRTRLRALLLPRSSVRVVWALSAHRAALTARWSALRPRLDGWSATIRRRAARQRG
ncbi:transglutaminaseTgpA domain-containing protein [Streptomyces sp. NPDC091272]|uniref:transglutaminase family protein n=1 Tax=Streptomyces sp. NPDC091272 TaxID=3365981 RepID=UPI003823F4FE